jgi:uncharacterized protein YbaR (Trm112 family)
MNTPIFDHYLTCPICQRNLTAKPVKACTGLFSCPYCQERLVVSQSGHFVRDPFILRQVLMSSALRRQSHPLARIFRDFILYKRPLVALAISSMVVLGMLGVMQQSTSVENHRIEKRE